MSEQRAARIPGSLVITDGEQLRRQYLEERLPVAAIATHYGCAINTVYAALIRYGLRRDVSLSDEMVVEIRRLYLSGRSIAGVAKDLGLTYARVNRAVRGAGIARPLKKAAVSQLSADELRTVYLTQRRSLKQVAELYECSIHTVRQALKRHCIPARPQGPNLNRSHVRQPVGAKTINAHDIPAIAESIMRESIMRRRRNGERVANIAAALAIPMWKVSAVISRQDPAPTRGGAVDEQLGASYDKGASVDHLAHDFNLSPAAVRAAIARHRTSRDNNTD